ncbi:MAG: tRNA uridine-5-carboxymethylaminomethyl(34) synthesis GTPase MnmE [Bacteroidota bacterium]
MVALATPTGVGAIAVIRLSGKNAITIANKSCSKDLLSAKSHTIHLGKILDEENLAIDEVLFSIFIAPKSYTRENVVEVSCHGSSYIIQQLLALYIRQGARLAQAGEFTQRAFLNGQLDLSQAEAVADLIASKSRQAHAIAMQQMRGGFSDDIKQLRQQLIDFASLIELELDFSEEDVEFADRTALKALVIKIQQVIEQLIHSFQLGNAIKHGVSTVLAGRPNAGKSTLLNALLNEDRAIVSDIAGTTRDTIEEVLNIKGLEFRLIDTAGIRDASDQIEAIGVEKTLEKIAQSAILLYIFDVIETPPKAVAEDLKKLTTPESKVLLIGNKMDLNPYTEYKHYADALSAVDIPLLAEHFIPLSAIHQMNIEHLKEQLYKTVVEEELTNSTIVSNSRHVEALHGAYESLDKALENMETGISSDFVAMDIRQALYYLGSITGEVSTDDLLSNIFSNFCIGK